MQRLLMHEVISRNFYILAQYGDSSSFPGKLWKFAPMSDKSVIEAHFRDSNHLMIPREISAVNDWKENSEENIHIMRDHPDHKFLIPDGLFGVRIPKIDPNNAFSRKLKNVYEQMMLTSRSMPPDQLNFVPLMLEVYLWKNAE